MQITAKAIPDLIHADIQSMKNCPHKLDCDHCPDTVCVKVAAIADFPSEFGQFKIIGFVNNKDRKDHVIVLKGDIGAGEDVLVRIHSACLTGDSLGSRRCDCGPQLREALMLIEAEGRGAVLYHQAEGRGIGLVNKLRAYVLQDDGMDTLDANVALGFAPDERDYEVPALMLKKLGIKSVELMTNNPEKVEALETHGVAVSKRRHIEPACHTDNNDYLSTKKERFGHLLDLVHKEVPRRRSN